MPRIIPKDFIAINFAKERCSECQAQIPYVLASFTCTGCGKTFCEWCQSEAHLLEHLG